MIQNSITFFQVYISIHIHTLNYWCHGHYSQLMWHLWGYLPVYHFKFMWCLLFTYYSSIFTWYGFFSCNYFNSISKIKYPFHIFNLCTHHGLNNIHYEEGKCIEWLFTLFRNSLYNCHNLVAKPTKKVLDLGIHIFWMTQLTSDHYYN